MPDSPRVLIALCTYNERQNVEQLIPLLRAAVPDADLLFVDDTRPMWTGQYIRQIGRLRPRACCCSTREERGVGVAVGPGSRSRSSRGMTCWLIWTLTSLHPPAVIPQLVKALRRTPMS